MLLCDIAHSWKMILGGHGKSWKSHGGKFLGKKCVNGSDAVGLCRSFILSRRTNDNDSATTSGTFCSFARSSRYVQTSVSKYFYTVCIAQCMLWCGVCLSVHLSVTLVYCVETTKPLIKQLALNCSKGSLVYGTPKEEHISLNRREEECALIFK